MIENYCQMQGTMKQQFALTHYVSKMKCCFSIVPYTWKYFLSSSVFQTLSDVHGETFCENS